METRGGVLSFLQLLVERSSRGERVRRRCATFVAFGILVGGLLAALGVALLVLGVLEVIALIGAAALATRGVGAGVLKRLTSAAALAVSSVVSLGSRIAEGARALDGARRSDVRRVRDEDSTYGWPLGSAASDIDDEWPTLEMAAVGTANCDRARARQQVWDRVSELLALQRRAGAAPADRREDAVEAPSLMEAEALRCNALGVMSRRAGRADHAVVLHEAARSIFAGVGDVRGEALAANGLAVALIEAGKQDAAWAQFERAQMLWQSLGDRQWEGKVLANVSLAKRRVGQDEQSRDLLRVALDKLAPNTDAYQRVERRLRRSD